MRNWQRKSVNFASLLLNHNNPRHAKLLTKATYCTGLLQEWETRCTRLLVIWL